MPAVWIVNPIPIPKGQTMAKREKRRRTAAQRAATARMIAANRRRRSASTRKRRARRRQSNPVAALNVRRYNASRRSRARRRSNPVGFVGDLADKLMPAAVGGLGAIALDVALAALPIPENFKSGALKPVVRVAGAIGLGALAGMVASRRVGNQVAAGALTVVLYDTAKGMLAQVAGGKIPGIGVYDVPGIGPVEVSPDLLSYMSPGIQVGNDNGNAAAAPAVLPNTGNMGEYVDGEGFYR